MRPGWLLVCALGAVLAVVPGCHPSAPTSADRAATRPSLAALADRIGRDAPAPRSLVAALPEVVRQEVQAHAPGGLPDEAMLEEARARFSRYPARLGEPATSRSVLEGFYLAEMLALQPGPARLRAAALLVAMYEKVQVPASVVVARDKMRRGVAVQLDSGSSDPFLPFWEVVQRDGAGQQAAFAALVLRSSPPDPLVLEVLRSMAQSIRGETRAQLELRLVLLIEVIAREGDQVTADSWLDVAETRLLMDDAAGALQALAQSERLAPRVVATDDLASAVAQVATRRTHLREEQQRVLTIQTLAGSTAPEDRLRRAALLSANQNLPEAREAYEQLRREMPRDARPVVGLVRLKFRGAIGPGTIEDVRASIDDMSRAADFDHRDGDYYELRIGLTGFEAFLMSGQAPGPESPEARVLALLGSLESLNREYMRFVPDRSAILGFVLQSVRSELAAGGPGSTGSEKRLQGYCTAGVALAARYPDTGDAFRLSLGCASLLDAERAFEVALRPLPEAVREDTSLAELRARVLVGLVARHRTFERLAPVHAAVKALPATSEALISLRESLLADLAGIAAVGYKGSWQDAVDAYQRARSVSLGSDGARLSNNLGVALSATLASPLNQVVVDHLKRSVALASSSSDQIARANLASLALANGSSDTALELLQPLLEEHPPPIVARLQAVAAASKLGQTALARAQATAALEELKPDNEAYVGFSGRPFVGARGALKLGIYVSGEVPYSLEFGNYYDTVLMLPSALSFPEITAVARAPEPGPASRPKRSPKP